MPDFFNLLVKQCLIIQQIFDYPVSFSLLNSHILYNAGVKLVLQLFKRASTQKQNSSVKSW